MTESRAGLASFEMGMPAWTSCVASPIRTLLASRSWNNTSVWTTSLKRAVSRFVTMAFGAGSGPPPADAACVDHRSSVLWCSFKCPSSFRQLAESFGRTVPIPNVQPSYSPLCDSRVVWPQSVTPDVVCVPASATAGLHPLWTASAMAGAGWVLFIG